YAGECCCSSTPRGHRRGGGAKGHESGIPDKELANQIAACA
ncbi:uncharacterized, partial [Tachysurus ichikawai]